MFNPSKHILSEIVIHLFPLAAALDETTNHYLAEDYALAFASSAAALYTAKKQMELSALREVEPARQRLLSVAYSGTAGSDHYLPNVLPEAQAIAQHFPNVTPLYEDQATPDEVIAHARGQHVVHFGCHGLFDTSLPQQSGLILSHGWLTVQRIITELKLSETDIATLGACLSGRLDITRGNELMGLTQSMLTAGAKAVVGSLWSVNDPATRALFESFYSRVAAGHAPAIAMQHAMQIVREQSGWDHPYYWAAFSVSGLAFGSGLTRPVIEPVISDIYKEHQLSNTQRGESPMSTEQSLLDAEAILFSISTEPEEILSILSETEWHDLLAKLEIYSAEAETTQKENELLALTDGILKFVEISPKLRELLLPKDYNVNEAQSQRKVTLAVHNKAMKESQNAQAKAAQVRNSLVKCRESLLKALKK